MVVYGGETSKAYDGLGEGRSVELNDKDMILIYNSPLVAPYNPVLPAMMLSSAEKLLRIGGRMDTRPPESPLAK